MALFWNINKVVTPVQNKYGFWTRHTTSTKYEIKLTPLGSVVFFPIWFPLVLVWFVFVIVMAFFLVFLKMISSSVNR